jgi:hypothetical protein
MEVQLRLHEGAEESALLLGYEKKVRAGRGLRRRRWGSSGQLLDIPCENGSGAHPAFFPMGIWG